MDNKKYRHIRLLRMLFLIQLLLPFISFAQTVNLYDAVNNAVKNYPLIHQRQAEVSAGQAHVNTVKGYRLPALILQDQFDMGTTNTLQGAYFSLGIVPSTPGGSGTVAPNYKPNPVNIALTSLQWEFYNFGYYNAQKKQAEAQLGVNEAVLDGDTYLLKENLISLYLDWLKKYRLLNIQNENMQRAQMILTAIRAMVMSGLKPGVDSSTARAVYEDAHIAYLQALDEYNYDKITLSSYTGFNAASIIPDTSFINATLPEGMLQQLPDSVSDNHPLLDFYRKQYELQKADNFTISRKYLPKFSLNSTAWVKNSGISYDGTYPNGISDGLSYDKYNYVFGVVFTFNLFDLRHRSDQQKEGRFYAVAKQDALKTQQLNLDRMMQQANAAYATTIEKIKVIPVQLYSARQAYEQQLALYRSGLNTLLEVTNAQFTLLQAETNYVITQDELLQLLYIRAGLSGQLDFFLQNFKR